MIDNLDYILDNSQTLSDLSRNIFGKENFTNREKCKKILLNHGIDWEAWIKEKKKTSKKFCLYCGKEILTGDKRKKFCNSSCAASYNNRLYHRKKEEKRCLNCGAILSNNRSKYCSRDCQSEFEYKSYISRWKEGKENGLSGEGGISDRIRRYLFEKNNCKCQQCGWGERNAFSDRIPLQIHHIDGDFKNNIEENLQLLCPNCHSLTENFGTIGGHKSTRKDRRTRGYLNCI